jgi:hypothetical protein
MAVQSLAPYYGKDPGVTSAVDGALAWLETQYVSDAEGNAQIIVALTALGRNADAYADALLAYDDAETGGFRRGAAVNLMATEQSAYALVAYDRLLNGKTALYDMSDSGSPVTPPVISDSTGSTGATPGPSAETGAASPAGGDGTGVADAGALIAATAAGGGKPAGVLDGEIPLGAINKWKNPFMDVNEKDWFYDAVKFMNALGLMVGTDDDVFSPGMNLSRAMVVTILWRMEGEPDAGAADGNGAFTDVPAGKWFSDAIAWANANEIVKGYGDGLFGPDDDVTREQSAVILYNYAKHKGLDAEADSFAYDYADIDDVSGWAREAMKWANANGLILGRSSTVLAPLGTATRAEVALIFERFIRKFIR